MQQGLIWGGNPNQIHKINGSTTFDKIPNGVYELVLTMTGAYLNKVSDKFEFNYKLYGMEQSFIDHAIKSFDSLPKNMGVLLSGLKGTGKTVTAKQLANLSNLPVILVTSATIGALGYFNDVEQPLCFFFDEFEKIIKQDDQMRMSEVLSFVDGTVTTQKHLMLFTSNSIRVNEFFIDRPGRIRYIKKFHSLNLEIVKEVIEDRLKDKSHAKELIEWVTYFKFLTIDLLISIIDEINIHNMSVEAFKEFFNADNDKTPYSVKYKFIDVSTGKSGIFETNEIVKDGAVPSKYLEDIVTGNRTMYIKGFKGKSYLNEKGDLTASILNDSAYTTNEWINNEYAFSSADNDLSFELQSLWNDSLEEASRGDDKGEFVVTLTNSDKTFTLYDTKSYQVELIADRESLYGGYTYSTGVF